MTQISLPPPPRTLNKDPVFYRWLVNLRYRISQDGQVLWSYVDKGGSNLSDIEIRPHSALTSILGVDETDTDTDKDKHLSNSLAKGYTDHLAATSAHGVTGDIVGNGDIATTADYGVLKQAVAVADGAAPTAYSAHAAGGVTVTSNAATDLDTTAAALKILRDEVATLTTKVNALLATLRTSDALDT